MYNEKSHVVDILAHSFIDNKSVNYIVKQDSKSFNRVRALMDYSFKVYYPKTKKPAP
jgi:hypothetical protein